MSKFYVQCGTQQFLTTAADAEAAALQAINHFLGTHVDLDSVDWLGDCPNEELLVELFFDDDAEFMAVSEYGFGHDDAGNLATNAIVTQWRQLVIAMVRLQEAFGE